MSTRKFLLMLLLQNIRVERCYILKLKIYEVQDWVFLFVLLAFSYYHLKRFKLWSLFMLEFIKMISRFLLMKLSRSYISSFCFEFEAITLGKQWSEAKALVNSPVIAYTYVVEFCSFKLITLDFVYKLRIIHCLLVCRYLQFQRKETVYEIF